MKLFPNNYLLFPWGLLVVMLIVTGCQGFGKSIGNITATVSSGTQVYTLIPPTETPTASQILGEIQTRVSTITPTVTVPPSIVWMPLPTLAADKAEMQVLELLNHNAGCRLPCWWGISPGITSWSDTNTTMQGLRLKPSLDNISGAYTLLYEFSGDNHALIFWMNFCLENDFVRTITFRTEGYNNLLSFKKVYANLAPEQIMIEYGNPSQIDMTGGFGSGGVYYVISFYYDDLGFAISYDGKAPFTDIHSTTVPICPTFGNKGNLTGGLGLELESNNIVLKHEGLSHSLMEAAGITPQDLYNLYISSKNGVCFDMPTDLWK